MKNKKALTIGLFISLIAFISGLSYAYFTATFQNLGVRQTSIATTSLGSLRLVGESVFASDNLFPGEIGVQEFSIEPVTEGMGVYEIDLAGVLPSAFGSDIEITLYKATSSNPSVAVTKGELTITNDQYTKIDTLTTSGVEIVYGPSALTNNSEIKLYQEEFENITVSNSLKIRENSSATAVDSYKYYLVYKYKDNGDQNSQMGLSFTGTISAKLITEKDSLSMKTLLALQELNPNIVLTQSTSTTPDFSIIAPRAANVNGDGKEAQTSGLFKLQDDYGDSYYFRGDIDYNYVKFGAWQTDWYQPDDNGNIHTTEYYSGYYPADKFASAGDDMYWRIVRINGDGSIRLIYDGTSAHSKNDLEYNSNGGYVIENTRIIGGIKFNTDFEDNAHVGYMYGEPSSNNYSDTHANINDSLVKTLLDGWYQIQMNGYSSYISDTLFCNDRSAASNDTISYYNTKHGGEPYTSNAFSYYNSMYGASGRLIDEIERGLGNKATLKCPQKHDAFTVNDTTYGNGDLTYPIGLLTMDEVNMAGAIDNSSNSQYYLYSGADFWTISPAYYWESSAFASVHEFSGGIGNTNYYRDSSYVRPVINLKADAITGGSGTVNDPFVVQ